MNNLINVLLAGGVGLLAGAVFFGGLYWTVEKGLTSKMPALLFIVSFLLRTGFVLASFYFTMDGQLSRILLCLAGFVIARIIVNAIIRKKTAIPGVNERGQEVNEHIA